MTTKDRAWHALSARLFEALSPVAKAALVGGTHVRRIEDNLVPGFSVEQVSRLRAQLAAGAGGELTPTATLKRSLTAPVLMKGLTMSIEEISDREIGTSFRSYLGWYTRGTLDELGFLYDEIAEADRTGFPWRPAVVALSKVKPRRLYRAFDDDELQDLYDLASEAGLGDEAARFAEACRARPYVDDGRVPAEVRRFVVERDAGRCQECGAREDLTIDHKIVPWVDGGSSKDPANLQLLCRSCNSREGTRPWPLVNDSSTDQFKRGADG
jgi:hypothetical protein